MPPTTRHWTTALIQVLAPLCLSAKLPWQLAFVVPALLLVDLYRRSQTLKREPIRAITIGEEKRKVRRLNGDRDITHQREVVFDTRPRWGLGTIFNLLLTAAVLDHALTHRFIPCQDVSYARTSALTEQSARIALRLPGYERSEIEYRPLVPGYPWRSSIPFNLESTRDWTAEVALEHLQPGVQYEYRIEGLEGQHNFTTFPDSRLDSPFRFIHAGTPHYPQQPYRPIGHHSQPTTTSLWHKVKEDRIRSPAWEGLRVWLRDMSDRTAWAPTRFALIGDMSKGAKTRQLMATSKEVFETIPVLSSTVRSNAYPEPGALTVPETQFSYGSSHFFRLQHPYMAPREDDQDWRIDVDELQRRLSAVNTTEWKFIISPMSLSPFHSTSPAIEEWREAVLDSLAYIPNVVVIAESKGDFRATILRRDIIEVTTPSLDGGRHEGLDLTRAREEPVTSYMLGTDGIPVQQVSFEKVDRLLRQFPAGRTNWSTIEVHGNRVYIVFVKDGQPIWRLEIVGEKAISKAVGTLGQSLQNAWSGVYSMVLSEESAESRKFKQKQNGDDHVGE